jgi:single-strand DNA-binding protein
MSDLNKWMGSGRLTRDAELRFTPAGTAVTDVSVCSNRVWSKDGEKQEEACFVDVTVWGKQGEAIAEYLKKGQYIMVEGRLKLDTWETDGNKRSKLRVVADRIHLAPRSTSPKTSSGSAPAANTNVPADEEIPF